MDTSSSGSWCTPFCAHKEAAKCHHVYLHSHFTWVHIGTERRCKPRLQQAPLLNRGLAAFSLGKATAFVKNAPKCWVGRSEWWDGWSISVSFHCLCWDHLYQRSEKGGHKLQPSTVCNHDHLPETASPLDETFPQEGCHLRLTAGVRCPNHCYYCY